MKIGVVGCGVIGGRRAENLPRGAELVACFDTDALRANDFAKRFGIRACSSFETLLKDCGLTAVFISPINAALFSVTQQSLDAGLDVLVEKPASRSFDELAKLSVPNGRTVKIGFNHRFHPAYHDLLRLLSSHADDHVMYARARYGNGARLGFDREWRSQVDLAGGGELLDQGVHVLDLVSGVIKNLEVKTAWVRTQFWDMPVDDNAWAILANAEGQTFSMHVSSTEWKNEFLFEVFTRQRKYVWSGLGRSYGPETLTIYEMKPEMGPPMVQQIDYPATDTSWKLENQNFADAVAKNTEVWGGLGDALQSLKWVKAIYELSAEVQSGSEIPPPQWFKLPT